MLHSVGASCTTCMLHISDILVTIYVVLDTKYRYLYLYQAILGSICSCWYTKELVPGSRSGVIMVAVLNIKELTDILGNLKINFIII